MSFVGKTFALLSMTTLASFSFAQSPVSCSVSGTAAEPEVHVQLAVPHADNLLVITPDGRKIYLRHPETQIQFMPSSDFKNVAEFALDRKTSGTWFNDWGEVESAALFGEFGQYTLVVDDNLESDLDSGQSLSAQNSCVFTIERD